MDVSGYKRKFKLLFDKILQPNFEVSAHHSENLLKYLDSSDDKCAGKILETPFFAELIVYALKNFKHTTTSVKVFIVKLVSIVLRNEVHFNRFLAMRGFDLLITKGKEECSAMPIPLHVAYIEQGIALTTHYSGVRYIMEQKIYKQMVRPYTHHRPQTLARCIYVFMTNLIWKLNEYEEEALLLEALQFVVQPFVANDFQTAINLGPDCEKTLSDQLVTFLNILVNILGETKYLVVANNVVPILSQFFTIESRLTTILEQTRDPELACLVAEVCLRYYFAASRQAALRDPSAESRLNEELNVSYNKIVCSLIKKGSVSTVISFVSKCYVYWNKVESLRPPASFERFGREFRLQNQFFVMLLVPIITKPKANQRVVTDQELTESMETFIYGLAAIICDDIVKAAYNLRNLVLEHGMTSSCLLAVREVRSLEGLLSKQQAGIVFQTLFYAMSEYVLSDGQGDLVLVENPLRTPDHVEELACILDTIKMLLNEHEINWYESLEIINLQAALMNLIKQNILPTKLLIQVVDLIVVGVRKLLPPELALLMQSERGGSLREVGGAARALIAHQEWQVREAALNLLLSLTEVAYVKYVSLRKVISEHGLLVAAARAALSEPEPRAQAVALRCLSAATRCECVWKELLTHYHNLYEQLVYIVRYNSDGEVRKEAAEVLTHVYINHKVTKTFIMCVSRVMAKAALEDIHWQVQVAALNFWKQYLKSKFTDIGMIDGNFPSVTFSKQKRKIIVLNEKEILKQLSAVMDLVANSGVLTVLLGCMNPYNNIEVIEITYNLVKKFVDALTRHKYIDYEKTRQLQASGSNGNIVRNSDIEMKNVKATSPDSMNKIKPDQGDLISEIFDCFGPDCPRDDTSTPLEITPPLKFIEKFKSTDYEAIIKSKKKSTEPANLDSLLDELLTPGKADHLSPESDM